MDLILLSLACVAFAMSRTGSRYQYLQTNTFRSKAESVPRNALIAAVNSRPSISRSTFVECAIQSCSSSSTSSVSCPPRCFRVRVRMRSIDALRVILPRYAAVIGKGRLCHSSFCQNGLNASCADFHSFTPISSPVL